jgi:hypothetical protein
MEPIVSEQFVHCVILETVFRDANGGAYTRLLISLNCPVCLHLGQVSLIFLSCFDIFPFLL